MLAIVLSIGGEIPGSCVLKELMASGGGGGVL